MEQVKASAGSGKTHDITQRFLAYLAQSPCKPYASHGGLAVQKGAAVQGDEALHAGGQWGDIMAITFTNMAAAEMKARVLESLKKCALAKPTASASTTTPPIMSPQEARAWIELILRQYGALNIRTIDSLLHLLVRTAALDLGLPPDFESSFHIQELMDPMFDALLEQARQGDAAMAEHVRAMCHSLVFHKEVQGFVMGSRLMTMLLPLVEFFLSEDVHACHDLSPAHEVEARVRHLEESVKSCVQELCTYIQKENLKPAKLAQECFIGTLAGEKKRLISAYYKKDSLDDCLLKASKGAASAEAERAFANAKEAVAALSGEGEVLRKALQMYPFVEVALLLAQNMLDFQRQESKVPAAKIPTMAREVLEGQYGVSAALCRLGNNLQHVLLDEFQDTSREQWQALRPLMQEALAQDGSLTWVGDVKQAIYGWRGGDAALFDAVLQEEKPLPWVPTSQKTLPINWRSREVIVNTNNALFTPLADATKARAILQAMLSDACPESVLDSATQKLCATFKGAAQEVKPNSDGSASGGYVCLEEVQAELKEELSEAVRLRLQEKLQDLGRRRPWGDITILTRSNGGATTVASWLLEWEIPAVTENSLLLQNHPLIQESVAFLSFLHCPQDDLSFWTLLTGHVMRAALRLTSHAEAEASMECENAEEDFFTLPQDSVVNIRPSLEELHTWLLQVKHDAKPVALAFAFQKTWPEFWEYAFAPFYGAAQMRTPYDCMQEWYGLWRVPRRFAEAQTFVRRFLEVIHSAEKRGAGTLGTFLEYWAQSGGEEKTPTPAKLDAVRIMTIHKSKGLQFPVVIIPWLSFTMRTATPPMIQNVGKYRVLATRNKLTENQDAFSTTENTGEAYYTAQAHDVLECLNVFYVACTRAQEELYAFHTHTPHILRSVNLAKGLTELFSLEEMTLPYEVGLPITKDGGHGDESSFEPEVDVPAASLTPHVHMEEMPYALDALNSMDSMDSMDACPIDFSQEPIRIMQWLPRLKIYRDPLQECLLWDAPLPSQYPYGDTDGQGSTTAQGESQKQGQEQGQAQAVRSSSSTYLSPARRGLLLHHCLEVWHSMGHKEDGESTAQAAAALGVQSFALPLMHVPHLQKEISASLLWYATLPGVQEWAQRALPEQTIINEQGQLYRADLVLPPKAHGQGWRVVEFKTGQEDSAHLVQLRNYLHMLDTMPTRDMSLPPSEGILIYLDLKKCRMLYKQDGVEKASELLDAPQWQAGA